MAKRLKDGTQQSGIFWSTMGLIFFLLVWLALCGAAFWYLFQIIVSRSSDPTVALSALQWMTWPFTVLAIAGPTLLILSIGGLRVIRDLLDMQKLFVGLPAQVESMQNTVTEFRALRTQLITDVSRVNEATTDDGGDEPSQESTQQQRPELTDFLQLYERAKKLFYDALEDHNTAASEPLIVQRGGANFSEIATLLRERRGYAKSDDRNHRVAEFVIKAFQLERNTRRHRATLTSQQVQDLQKLSNAV